MKCHKGFWFSIQCDEKSSKFKSNSHQEFFFCVQPMVVLSVKEYLYSFFFSSFNSNEKSQCRRHNIYTQKIWNNMMRWRYDEPNQKNKKNVPSHEFMPHNKLYTPYLLSHFPMPRGKFRHFYLSFSVTFLSSAIFSNAPQHVKEHGANIYNSIHKALYYLYRWHLYRQSSEKWMTN